MVKNAVSFSRQKVMSREKVLEGTYYQLLLSGRKCNVAYAPKMTTIVMVSKMNGRFKNSN